MVRDVLQSEDISRLGNGGAFVSLPKVDHMTVVRMPHWYTEPRLRAVVRDPRREHEGGRGRLTAEEVAAIVS